MNYQHCTRKMCACVRTVRCSVYTVRRVHACCYWPSAKFVIKKMQDYKWNQNSCRLGRQSRSSRSCQLFSEAILLLSFFTFCPTTTHESATFANLGPKMTNCTMLGLVTGLKMMVVVGVLNFSIPQRIPSSENLAIPKILESRIQCVVFDESLISLEYKVLLVLQHIEDS